MKDVYGMTVEEMKEEMRTYQCDKRKGYAFISYSHRDREKVYPLVLEWMRAGYNIYIDLDFARHGSDSNWVNLMMKALSNELCHLAICFGSMHYTYSYAALLELLTIRGKKVTSLHDDKLPLDYFVIGEISMGNNRIREEYQPMYERYFSNLKNDMGKTFLRQNAMERDTLYKGLEYWIATKERSRGDNSAEEWMEYLSDAYENGYLSFFPMIARLIKKWIVSQGLNTNYYSLDIDRKTQFERFDMNEVERLDRHAAFWEQKGAAENQPDGEYGQEEGTELLPGRDGGGENLYGSQAGFCLIHVRSTERISIDRPVFRIGRRTERNDYAIPWNRFVGSWHCEIRQRNGECYIIDNNSKNHTFVEGKMIYPYDEVKLISGQRIKLADEEFEFRRQSV